MNHSNIFVHDLPVSNIIYLVQIHMDGTSNCKCTTFPLTLLVHYFLERWLWLQASCSWRWWWWRLSSWWQVRDGCQNAANASRTSRFEAKWPLLVPRENIRRIGQNQINQNLNNHKHQHLHQHVCERQIHLQYLAWMFPRNPFSNMFVCAYVLRELFIFSKALEGNEIYVYVYVKGKVCCIYICVGARRRKYLLYWSSNHPLLTLLLHILGCKIRKTTVTH